MQRYERLWERLLTLLGTLGEVEPREDGRLLLTIDGHRIELVMTESEWDDLVGIPYGSFTGGANHLLHMIGRAQMDGSPYLVYDTYELHASDTSEGPGLAEAEAEAERVRAYRAAHPGAKGEWRAFSPDRDEPGSRARGSNPGPTSRHGQAQPPTP